jgi:chemotaxis protein MotB
VLPCYTAGPRSRQTDCPKTKAKVEAIFIEGHTDSDQFRAPTASFSPAPGNQRRPSSSPQNPPPNAPPFNWLSPGPPSGTAAIPAERRPTPGTPRVTFPPKDNLDLSALRATNTFRKLLKEKTELREYQSPSGTPILSVSGYGEDRPVAAEPGESIERFKQRNRRIDLRILMATVKSEDAKRMQQDINRFEMHR